MSAIELRVVDPLSKDLHTLIAKLDSDLLNRYPAQAIHGINFGDPRIERTTFVVAFVGGTAVACGAIRPLDAQYTELKRMFVDTMQRGQGIASAVLKLLETTAIADGFAFMRLECGEAQPEALGLYHKFGYYRIDRFGEYVDDETSVCMEKPLS